MVDTIELRTDTIGKCRFAHIRRKGGQTARLHSHDRIPDCKINRVDEPLPWDPQSPKLTLLHTRAVTPDAYPKSWSRTESGTPMHSRMIGSECISNLIFGSTLSKKTTPPIHWIDGDSCGSGGRI